MSSSNRYVCRVASERQLTPWTRACSSMSSSTSVMLRHTCTSRPAWRSTRATRSVHTNKAAWPTRESVRVRPMHTVGVPSEDQTAAMREAMPFAGLLGVEIVANEPDEVRARLAWDPSRCTTGGALHGGALMGLADTVGGMAAFL